MQLHGRPGTLFVTCDGDEVRSKGGIWYPPKMQGKAKTGLCLLHFVSSAWDEVDLTNKRVVFDRWSGRPFTLRWSDGHLYDFICLSQWSVLAIIEEDPFSDHHPPPLHHNGDSK